MKGLKSLKTLSITLAYRDKNDRMGCNFNANVTLQRTLSSGRGTFPSFDGVSLRSWSRWEEEKSLVIRFSSIFSDRLLKFMKFEI